MLLVISCPRMIHVSQSLLTSFLVGTSVEAEQDASRVEEGFQEHQAKGEEGRRMAIRSTFFLVGILLSFPETEITGNAIDRQAI